MVDPERRRVFSRWVSRALVALAAVAAGTLTGCVERRYTIRTNPPGALVIANGEEIGRTPVSKSFTFYGDRDFTLMLDGYETRKVIQPVKSPWYDNLLTEFFSENLLPMTVRDERTFDYDLKPAEVPSTNQLLARGEALRAQAQAPPPARRGGILGFLGF